MSSRYVGIDVLWALNFKQICSLGNFRAIQCKKKRGDVKRVETNQIIQRNAAIGPYKIKRPSLVIMVEYWPPLRTIRVLEERSIHSQISRVSYISSRK